MPYHFLRSLLATVFLFSLSLYSQSVSDVRGRGDITPDIMTRTRMLAGTVYTTDGVPVAGAWITVRNLRSGEVVFTGTTAADGGFETTVDGGQSFEVQARSGIEEDHTIARAEDAMALRMTLPVRSAPNSGGNASVSLGDLKAPPKAKQALEKAKEALRNNDGEKAHTQLEKALKEYRDYPTALTLLALVEAPKDHDGALALARRAAALSPQDGFPRAILAGFLNDSNEPDEALKEADAAIANASQLWQGHFERARALAARGRLEEALASAVRADALAQGRVLAARVGRTRLLAALGRHDEAIEGLNAFIQAAPDKATRDRAAAEAIAIKSFAKK
jgi:tetratricopeptide (TPR) repeat protein